MGSGNYGVGRILVVCAHCGFKYYTYALGDPGNRNKYSGPPTLSQALSGHGGSCPRCGRRPTLARPARIRILTKAEYETMYVETRYTVMLRERFEELYSTPATAVEAGQAVEAL